ncbi:MAG: MFS transporter [Alphaproteobacteria bacterium]
MLAALAPVAALLVSVAILFAGNGLQGTLLPLRAQIESFSPLSIGVMGSAYYAGFVAGCLIGPFVVRRAGHIRAYAALVAIASCTALAHAVLVEPVVWWIGRAVTGFCFSALFMIVESWLNETSTNETRGRVFSTYIIINLSMMTAGQFLLTLDSPASFALFALASALVSLATVPLSLTTQAQPAPLQRVQVRVRRLFRISPVGFVGCLAVGAGNGAFWALGPVFAQADGDDSTLRVALFISLAAMAGAISQWPIGFLSDRMDRRLVIVGCALGATAASGLLVLFGIGTGLWLYLLAAGYGLFAFPLYGLSVAHTNDYVDREDYVETASALLLIFAGGATIGPFVASSAMQAWGPEALFGFSGLAYLLLAGFAVIRMRSRAAVSEAERATFAEAAVAAQTVSTIDPGLGEELDDADDDHPA